MTSKTDNRTRGGKFEQELAGELYDHGFWCHVIQQNKSGQPADIIAVKGKYHTLIDCKVVSDEHGFTFDRIEENQKFAMRMFHKRCMDMCYFAIRLPDGSVWMLSLERIDMLRMKHMKGLRESVLRKEAWPLEKWLNASDTWAEDV